jgi:hypothetical protein
VSVFEQPAVIVDLETTGADPAFARVTEIGVIELEHGDARALWAFIRHVRESVPAGRIEQAAGEILRRTPTPSPFRVWRRGDLAHIAKHDLGASMALSAIVQYSDVVFGAGKCRRSRGTAFLGRPRESRFPGVGARCAIDMSSPVALALPWSRRHS